MSGQRPSLSELLRVIAEEESLDRTLARFPGLSRTDLVGVLLGLRRAQELGAEELEVVADSELVIRQLSGAYQVKAPALRELHSEALSLLKAFRKVKLVHVPRAENAEADEMSNRAIDEKM